MEIVLFNGLRTIMRYQCPFEPDRCELEQCYHGNNIYYDVEKVWQTLSEDFKTLDSKENFRTDPEFIELAKKFYCFTIADIPDEATDYTIKAWHPTAMPWVLHNKLYYVIEGKIKEYFKPKAVVQAIEDIVRVKFKK